MPDDGVARVGPAAEAPTSGRSGRAPVVAFITDADSEAALRQGLLVAAAEGMVVHRTNGRGAIAALTKMVTPRVLVVDVSEDEQPLSTLAALSEVVEPDVRVLVVGDRADINLYRQLTRGLGVAEYLYKPLNAEVVAQYFGPFVSHAAPAAAGAAQGGRVVTLTGACGGAGATTLSTNLAWHLAVETKRHTVLLDPDLQTGTAAMLLGAKAGPGLRTALETPQRVDELFMERIALPAADRLAVIAGEEKLSDTIAQAAGSTQRLMQALRLRYNYVIVDLPFGPVPVYRELLEQARQRVFVMEPTLAAVRDTIRLLALPMGSQQARGAVLVLNKLGAPGTMSRRQVEEALQRTIDVVVPYLPRVVAPAATMGQPACAARGGFRTAIHALALEVAAVGVQSSAQRAPSGRFGRLFARRG